MPQREFCYFAAYSYFLYLFFALLAYLSHSRLDALGSNLIGPALYYFVFLHFHYYLTIIIKYILDLTSEMNGKSLISYVNIFHL